MAETETRTRITQSGTVAVPVSDQDQALEFYVDKLGFEKRIDARSARGDRWIEVAPPGAATTIAIVPPRPGESAGIKAPYRLDVRRHRRGSRAAPVSRGRRGRGGSRLGDPVPSSMFFFSDPDGNKFFVAERA